MILPSFADPHPRVRWAVANAAGQLATDFGPKLQKTYHSTLLPRFTALLGDVANPKYVPYPLPSCDPILSIFLGTIFFGVSEGELRKAKFWRIEAFFQNKRFFLQPSFDF